MQVSQALLFRLEKQTSKNVADTTFKLHISNQMKPYSNVKTIWGLIYTRFGVFWVLEHVGKIGPEYPKSWARTPHFRSIEALLKYKSHLKHLVEFYLFYGIWGTLWKLGPNRVLIPQIIVRKIQKVIQSL